MGGVHVAARDMSQSSFIIECVAIIRQTRVQGCNHHIVAGEVI